MLTLPLLLVAAGCKPEPAGNNAPLISTNAGNTGNGSANANENTNTNATGNGNNAAGNNAPAPVKFTDPWTRAKVGDTAVYAEKSVERIWTVREIGSRVVVQKLEPGVRMPGEDPDSPPPEDKITTAPIDRTPNPALPAWWTLATRDEAEAVEVALPGGVTVAALRFTVDSYGDTGDSYTFTVSDAVPFDGIVSISVNDGAPIRKLVSFSFGQ